MLRIIQPEVRPGFAGIDGLVHAVPERNVAADAGLTGSNIDDLGVRWRYGDAANRGDGLVVEDRGPGEAAIRRLPDATGHGSKIICVWIAGNSRNGEHASPTKRAYEPPLHSFQCVFFESLRQQRSAKHGKANQHYC